MQFNNRRFMNKFGRIVAGLIIAGVVGGYNYLTNNNGSTGNQNGGKNTSGKAPPNDN